ncbi:MAG: hypothetical protein U1A07_04475, partial [Phenylobacterium sp.]|nr:hypothetical protein [Phenylobacterium sp.]
MVLLPLTTLGLVAAALAALSPQSSPLSSPLVLTLGQSHAANAALAALTATADAFPDQTALDAMIDSIAPDLLQGQAAAALKPVIEMIAASADYVEVHDALSGIFPDMNTQQLE